MHLDCVLPNVGASAVPEGVRGFLCGSFAAAATEEVVSWIACCRGRGAAERLVRYFIPEEVSCFTHTDKTDACVIL